MDNGTLNTNRSPPSPRLARSLPIFRLFPKNPPDSSPDRSTSVDTDMTRVSTRHNQDSVPQMVLMGEYGT